jgi:CheY-like chemotaxis protein/chemotaxis protein CheY-P-specific phosphatase CheC
MTIPVLICDDSGFARKQIARALPDNWDAELNYAANGQEALIAIREGKADVLFLDLTMPVLDGFGVLEAIRNEDLPTLPIVVSGDIQEESRQRVMALGAVAFLKKPVNSTELIEVLNTYGLMQLTEEPLLSNQSEAFSEEVGFTDWCQELANVSKGRAADLLARVINRHVEMSIPSVFNCDPSKLAARLSSGRTRWENPIVTQGFTGAGIAGEMLLLFDESSLEFLNELLYGPSEEITESDIEALMDLADIFIGAFLRALGEQLDLQFSIGQPHLGREKDLLRFWVSEDGQRKGEILSIECDYTIAGEIKVKQMVLFSAKSADALQQRAEVSMD